MANRKFVKLWLLSLFFIVGLYVWVNGPNDVNKEALDRFCKINNQSTAAFEWQCFKNAFNLTQVERLEITPYTFSRRLSIAKIGVQILEHDPNTSTYKISSDGRNIYYYDKSLGMDSIIYVIFPGEK